MGEEEKSQTGWDWKWWGQAFLTVAAIATMLVVGYWTASSEVMREAAKTALGSFVRILVLIIVTLAALAIFYRRVYRGTIAKALADIDRDDKIRPLDTFMHARPYVHVQDGHGATYNRDPSDETISVKFGIEVINYGNQHVRVRDIRNLRVRVEWGEGYASFAQSKPVNVDHLADMDGPTPYTPIHTVDVRNIPVHGHHGMRAQEPSSTAKFGSVSVAATLVLDGDPRTLLIDDSVPIPFKIGNSPELDRAVNHIRFELETRHSVPPGERSAAWNNELVDVRLKFRNHGLTWHLTFNPRVDVDVPLTVGVTEEAAYTKTMLDKVVASAVERMNAILAGKSTPTNEVEP